jgi:signal transduction histidine kinase/CheY-like chemotaxis protein
MSLFPIARTDANPESRLSFTEFQKSTFRMILILSGSACLAWQLLVFALHPENLLGYDGLILLLVVVVNGMAIWLLERFSGASVAIWGVGVSIIVGISTVAYRQPVASMFYILIPLIAVTLFGWLAGLMVAGLSAVVMVLLGRLIPGISIQNEYLLPVVIGGIVISTIGWVVRHSMIETIRVYWENYERATAGIEEARQQRLELKQTQEDLILANRELTRLAKRLEVLEQIAEEARRAKENFVATVSHELRTPLNMIIGFSEVIAESPQTYGIRLPPTLLADIASIRRNSQHLLELVNDVLDLSQVDMGNMAISRDWCSLRQIVEEAFEVIRPLFVSKVLYLEANLPEEDQRIYCDGTRIREVIINLLSNAGRFTEKGGVGLRASIKGNDLVIAVRDTGPGISVENQKKLFEPFQQLDSSIRRQHGGSGLGLAISKRFVEMHGGQVWLESTVGVGTTVYFSLPLPIPDPDLSKGASVTRWFNPHETYVPRDRPSKAPHQTPSPRCLVLEEGNMVRRLFERYLGDVEIVPVTDIDRAVSELNKSPAQLLVINHRQGAEILNSVSSRNRLPLGMPAIAFWLPGGRDYADEMGVFRYLIKPVTKEMLLGTLEKLGDGIQSVLLVDDNPEVLQLFGRILASAQRGYRVWRASDGQQALEMLRKRKPDVMILDLIMPDVNGFQVLKEKGNDPSIRETPVIVITAQDPSGMPKMSDTVSVSREGGFSSRDLVDLVRFLGLNAELKPQQS